MTRLSDDTLEGMFDEFLDEVYGDVEICGLRYDASVVLSKVDTIAYRCAFLDWLDGEMTEGIIHEHSDGSYHDEPEDEDEGQRGT